MYLPRSFKAAVVTEPKAQNFICDRSLEPLVSGEVGIKITATAVNPVDWKMRDYNAFITAYPAVLGSDAAGIIAAVGPNVSNFKIGDRVFFQGIIGSYDSSTFQQFCKMPAALVSKTPSNISDEQAAGISLGTMAAVTAFYDKEGHGLTAPWEEGGLNAGKGTAIVIIGGASSVGQYAIQLARLSGFERIITNASAVNHEFLKGLGAHAVLDRGQSGPEDFAAAIGGCPLAFVFDAISMKSTQILSVQIVQATKTENSHVVTVHVVHPEAVDEDAAALGQSKDPKVDIRQVLGIGSSPALRYLSEPLAKHLGGENGYIAKNLFTPNRPRLVSGGLSAVEEALTLNKKGVSGEKVIFRPFDL
jgi:NADPH:quinone reductase-like Zn-dependent oxidoreductase